MCRRFLYVFLAVIAFQFSWNMLAVYCAHESGRAALHFGHHEHHASVDELSVAAADKQGTTKQSLHDTHCCSAAHMSLVAPDLREALMVATIASMPHGVPFIPASAFPNPPERPQWTGRA